MPINMTSEETADQLLKDEKYIRKSLDEWLNEVDYRDLNEGNYVPSVFALMFVNFIKLVNGEQGESHKTPPLHLKMLDKVVGGNDYIANLIFRGAAKTTVFMEYFSLFLGYYGEIPGFGDVTGMIYVSDSMENGVKSARKNIEFRYNNSEFLLEHLPFASFTDNYLEFRNKNGHRLGIKMFGAKTGLRGTKIFGKRPTVAVLDDLVSDDDSKSKVAMEAIKDTVYKGIDHALDPTRRKVIFNGTPFNKEDILIEAVESGSWDVNVWPVCEQWPVSEEDFVGAWPDRFTFKYVEKMYERAVLNGKVAAFMQELMLRITSDEERLVLDEDIKWYSRDLLIQYKNNYNFYITTDLALSDKESADYSVIAVWAINANGDWFWVDGVVHRKTISHTYDELFRLVQKWKPQGVGIEVSGQQSGFIPWLKEMQARRNIWFTFASHGNGGKPGIRPTQNKLVRFNGMVPMFKMGKIHFPQEMSTSKILGHFIGQIKLATVSGLKGKDDCIDTISMLQYMNPWMPSEASPEMGEGATLWDNSTEAPNDSPSLNNYIV